MATIQRFPFVRHLRSEPTYHVLLYRDGDLRRDGAGLAFWFRPIATAVAEVPIDDRELPFLFRVRCSSPATSCSRSGRTAWSPTSPSTSTVSP